jgi:multiple sugar transport system substrate-binding protein
MEPPAASPAFRPEAPPPDTQVTTIVATLVWSVDRSDEGRRVSIAIRPELRTRRDLLKWTTGAIGSAAVSEAGALAARSFAPRPVAAEAALNVALPDDHADQVHPLLDEFQRSTGTSINLLSLPRDVLYTELTISLTQGTELYDVVALDDAWMPQFLAAEPFDDLRPDGDETTEPVEYLPGLASVGSAPGFREIFGVPWTATIKAFCWRAESLAAAGGGTPATYDDAVAIATAITAEHEGMHGYGVAGQPGAASASSYLTALWGYGGTMLAPKSSEPLLASPVARMAMQSFLALAAQSPPEPVATTFALNAEMLLRGEIAMSSDVWSDSLLKAWNDGRAAEVGALSVGAGLAQPGRLPPATIAAWVLAVPKRAPEREAAKALVRHLTSRSAGRALLDYGLLPARSDAVTDVDAAKRYPFLPSLLASARFARTRPRSPVYPTLEPILGQYVSEALAGQLTGTAALYRADREMRDVLVREGILE